MKHKVLIAGGSGLIGSRLTEYLDSQHYQFHILSRSQKNDRDNIKYFLWDTDKKEIDQAAFEGVDTVINLAGAGIADKRWTPDRKKILLDSRTKSIVTLSQSLDKLDKDQRPQLFIGASAVGYYGDQGDKKLTESDTTGTGFLAEITSQWEAASFQLANKFSRYTLLRIGIVLSKKGGALKEILKPAAIGSYGYFGKGNAYYAWIHIDDICNLIKAQIEDENYSGIYNATAPVPLTIKELVTALKKAKGGIGLVMPVPTIALKLTLGEMTHMLTDSTRAVPERLLSSAFKFEYEEPVQAMKHILKEGV